MEAIFLNAVQAVSDSRFWLMPLLLACVLVILGSIIFHDVQEEIEAWKKPVSQ